MSDYTITGLEEHLKKIKALPEELDDALRRNMNQLGNEWMAEAQRLTPYDTGKLAQGWRFDGVEKVNGRFMITLYNNTEYAAPVEYGRRVGRGGFLPGKRMLAISRQTAYKALPKVIRRAMQEVIK